MNQFLIGNEKSGCLVDNENKVFEYYELLSLYEKMNKEQNKLSLNYCDIDFIDISYSLVNSHFGGSATICLSVHTKDQTYDCPLYFAGVPHNHYIQFSETLLQSGLTLHDPKEILKSIIKNKETPIGTLLFELDKIKK